MDIDEKLVEQIVREVVEKLVPPGCSISQASPLFNNAGCEVISAKDIERLQSINSPTICNAIESFKVRDDTDGYATSELKCMRPELKPMVGFTITVSVDSTTPASLEKRKFWEKFDEILNLINISPKPVIAVFKDIGPQRNKCCITGDMLASAFSSIGAVGVVTDSCMRDLTEMEKNAKDFQVFATGLVVSHGLPNIFEIGPTVNICGLTIKQGDLLHGDRSGLVKIPLDFVYVSQLLDRCEQILQREKEYFDFMKSDKYSFEKMKKMLIPDFTAKNK
jgi:4-hydroxy-4-methyl-2-oxoglutarate aldolase